MNKWQTSIQRLVVLNNVSIVPESIHGYAQVGESFASWLGIG